MSCKYCELKRRKDDDVEWIAGEDWESESDDGGYICQHGDGFRMLVYYDARYACTAVDNVKYCPFCGEKLKLAAEPLIKDEKIRKAVRAWAEAAEIDAVEIVSKYQLISLDEQSSIEFLSEIYPDYVHNEEHTIAELCGEEE